jgi:hypothetical protein
MTDVPNHFTLISNAVIAAFNDEFAAEGFTMIPDRLHESLGRRRVAVGISPDEDTPNIRTRIAEQFYVTVQFYGLWDEKIDPETQINPSVVVGYAARLKEALRRTQVSDPGTSAVWYFDVDRTRYPNDPTGNKSRFEMSIRAWGNNSNLIETTA